MFCPVCGNQIDENVKFCSNCGALLSDSDDEEIEFDRLIQNKQMIKTVNDGDFCAKCGRPLKPGEQICSHCGKTVLNYSNFEEYPTPNPMPPGPFGSDDFEKRAVPNSMPPGPFGVDDFNKRPMPKRASPAGKIIILFIIIILVVLYFVLFR